MKTIKGISGYFFLSFLIFNLFSNFSLAKKIDKAVQLGTRELQFENEKVKVWKTKLNPKERLDMHRHDTDRVVIPLTTGKLTAQTDSGESKVIPLERGKALWSRPNPPNQLHNDINETDELLEIIVVELKN